MFAANKASQIAFDIKLQKLQKAIQNLCTHAENNQNINRSVLRKHINALKEKIKKIPTDLDNEAQLVQLDKTLLETCCNLNNLPGKAASVLADELRRFIVAEGVNDAQEKTLRHTIHTEINIYFEKVYGKSLPRLMGARHYTFVGEDPKTMQALQDDPKLQARFLIIANEEIKQNDKHSKNKKNNEYLRAQLAWVDLRKIRRKYPFTCAYQRFAVLVHHISNHLMPERRQAIVSLLKTLTDINNNPKLTTEKQKAERLKIAFAATYQQIKQQARHPFFGSQSDTADFLAKFIREEFKVAITSFKIENESAKYKSMEEIYQRPSDVVNKKQTNPRHASTVINTYFQEVYGHSLKTHMGKCKYTFANDKIAWSLGDPVDQARARVIAHEETKENAKHGKNKKENEKLLKVLASFDLAKDKETFPFTCAYQRFRIIVYRSYHTLSTKGQNAIQGLLRDFAELYQDDSRTEQQKAQCMKDKIVFAYNCITFSFADTVFTGRTARQLARFMFEEFGIQEKNFPHMNVPRYYRDPEIEEKGQSTTTDSSSDTDSLPSEREIANGPPRRRNSEIGPSSEAVRGLGFLGNGPFKKVEVDTVSHPPHTGKRWSV
jgi:hypothetical protein